MESRIFTIRKRVQELFEIESIKGGEYKTYQLSREEEIRTIDEIRF
jgi:hypothetical protein